MRTIGVKFSSYSKTYAFNTDLPIKEGKIYKIATPEGAYPSGVYVLGEVEPPRGIALKTIIAATEVVEDA